MFFYIRGYHEISVFGIPKVKYLEEKHKDSGGSGKTTKKYKKSEL